MNRESSALCERAIRIHLRIWAALFIAAFVLLGIGVPGAFAQSYLQNVGTPSFTTSLPVENGFVNVSNGNLHIEIPLASYPQRARGQYKAALVYDSAIWAPGTSAWTPTNVTTPAGGPSWGGWRLITSGDQGAITATEVQTACYYYYFWSWTAPDGTRKSFPDVLIRADVCEPSGIGHIPHGSGWASDGSGYFLAINNWCEPTLYAPDGTKIFVGGACWSTAQRWKDTNGNYYYQNTDTLARIVPYSTSTTNCDGNPNKICYDVYKVEGYTHRYSVITSTIDAHTDFDTGLTEYDDPITIIESITLPDGTSYTFDYDSGTSAGHYGQLTSMTLPTGGVITYDYDVFEDSTYPAKKSSWVVSRETPDGMWSYVPDVVDACTDSDEVNCAQKVTVTKPSLDTSVYTFRLNGGAWNSEVKHYTGSSTLLATIVRCFDFVTVTDGQCEYDVEEGDAAATVYQTGETTTLPIPSSTNISKTTAYTHDDYGNVTQVKEWQYYSGTLPSTPYRTTTTSYAHANYTSYPNFWSQYILNRPELIQVTDANGTVRQTWYSYDQVGTGSLTGAQNHDDTNYGIGFYSRGNLTGTYGFLTGSDWLTLGYMAYDMTGQLLYQWDPLNGIGNATVYSHADNFFTDPGNTSNPAACTGCPNTNAYVTAIARPIIGTSYLGYYWTGQLAKSTDVNGRTTNFHYADPLSRPTATSLPNGGWSLSVYPSSSQTQVDTYAAITSTSLSSSCTSCRHDQLELDTLGRVKKAHLVSDPSGDTIVETQYDDNGRVLQTRNPYRGTPVNEWQVPHYDGLNRVTEVQHPDTDVAYTYYGAAVSSGGGISSRLCSSSILAYPVLSVDEVGRKRQTWTDAFGRVVEIDEPDASGSLTLKTCYTHDANGNLTGVTAADGSQTRSYTYDRLSRLLCKTEPETGTTNFYYNSSGGSACGVPASTSLCSGDPSLVCRKVDARSITTTYTYDMLNRLTQKSYSDSTPTAKYYYDSTDCLSLSVTCYNKGRRTGISEGSGSSPTTKWAFDAMGNVLRESRKINDVTKTIDYTYNLDGSIAKIFYPDSSRTVVYTYNNAQRASKAEGKTSGGTTYATYADASSYAMYAPSGAPTSIVFGVASGFSGITETRTYNNRLQLTGILASSTAATALDLSYSYTQSSHNNGDITTQTNSESGGSGRTQTYTYDNLDRLLTAQAAATSGGDCWGQAFGNNATPPTLAASALANLFHTSSTKCSSPAPQFTVNGNNQFSTSGFSYDSAGNNTADALWSYTYDAENRIITASGMTGGPYCYTYDADGIRTAKAHVTPSYSCTTAAPNAPIVDILYWRNIAGNTIAETDKDGYVNNSSYREYVFFAGRRIARADYGSSSFTVYYYFVDHLGSTRAMTGDTGSVCFKADYLPYGAENTPANFTNSCNTTYKFTGYERDAETSPNGNGRDGLDYAFARYYNQRLARFMSADPLGGNVGDPQSLNRYAYTRNNSINRIDPGGMSDCWVNGIWVPGREPRDPPRLLPGFFDIKNCDPDDYDSAVYWNEYIEQQGGAGSEIPIYCRGDVIAAMNRAWNKASNGLGKEAGFNLGGDPLNPSISEIFFTNEFAQMTIEITVTGPDRTFAQVHVHRNAAGPMPSTPETSPNHKGDTWEANRNQIDIYVISSRGLSYYDYRTRQSRMLRKNMDWKDPSKPGKPCS